MNIPVLRAVQSGLVLYLGVMSAEQILACCHTTEWDPDLGWDLDRQGYQRAPLDEHYRTIGGFLRSNPRALMPSSALLSARERETGALNFTQKATTGQTEFGELEIEDWRQFSIIDYQHRWRGFMYAIEVLGADELKEFVIPVTIIADISRADEIEQFYLINSKQKRIDTDLALALLQTLASEAELPRLLNLVGAGKRYRIRATRLTFRLAEMNLAPWGGRIMQPHDLPQPGGVLAVKSFVDSLAPVLSTRSLTGRLSDDELLTVLIDFWSALARIVPVAFQEPENHQIQRTVGTFAFNLLFTRDIYPRARVRGDTTTQGFEQLLRHIDPRYLTAEFWKTGGPARVYVGSSGWRDLRDLMRMTLP
ncbi:MAG TPA: DGQHR domain-containing protein [Dehalococcoidia bacterium]|nr:DGQHR domain-containing protein [Dehalococcoidia bacterium]